MLHLATRELFVTVWIFTHTRKHFSEVFYKVDNTLGWLLLNLVCRAGAVCSLPKVNRRMTKTKEELQEIRTSCQIQNHRSCNDNLIAYIGWNTTAVTEVTSKTILHYRCWIDRGWGKGFTVTFSALCERLTKRAHLIMHSCFFFLF